MILLLVATFLSFASHFSCCTNGRVNVGSYISTLSGEKNRIKGSRTERMLLQTDGVRVDP